MIERLVIAAVYLLLPFFMVTFIWALLKYLNWLFGG